MKVCKKCKISKPLTQFDKISTKPGFTARCRKCIQNKQNEYRRVYKRHKDHRSLKERYRTYKKDARKREYVFEIDIDFFNQITKGICFYCKAEPNPVNGVDRYDNRIGYLKSNCVSCCKDCNRAKGTLSIEQFIDLCKRITMNMG